MVNAATKVYFWHCELCLRCGELSPHFSGKYWPIKTLSLRQLFHQPECSINKAALIICKTCLSPAFLADIQILSMFPSLLFTTSGFRWSAAKMLFIFWWLGRPEDSLRDYLLPSCAANCSLCSLLLATPQDSAVRENRRILEELSFHWCEARA